MWMMSRRKLRTCIDEPRVLEAIRLAERVSSGEIRVSLAPFSWGNVEKAARKAFVRMEMDRTDQRNAVLIFLVPSRKRFAIVGDQGIHACVGQAFWESVAASLSEHFRHGEFTEGLVRGIATVSAQLAEHFPWNEASDRDELSNEVDYGLS